MTIRLIGKEKRVYDGSVGELIPYLLYPLYQISAENFEARSN